MFRTRSSRLLVLIFLLLPPGPASAQQRESYELPSISLTAPPANDPQMTQLYEQGRWAEAAKLYELAATNRENRDPTAYGDFDRAGRLYFYAGDYAAARTMMEQAGEIAASTGDMVNAAMRYSDAAFCAVWEGYPGKRRELVAKAEAAAAAPSVSAADRERILARTRGVKALSVGGH